MPDDSNQQMGSGGGLSAYDLIKLSTRIFTVKPMRTVLTILGTSIGIGTVVFLISLGYGLQFILLGSLVTTEDSLVTLEAAYAQETDLNIKKVELEELSTMSDIGEISPVADFPAELKYSDSPGLIQVRAVRPNYSRLSGVVPDLGANFTEDHPGIILSAQAAKLINLPVSLESIGKKVTVNVYYLDVNGVGEETTTEEPLEILGFLTDEAEAPIALLPISMLKLEPPYYKSVFVKADDIEAVAVIKDRLIEKGYLISARLDLVNQAQKILNIITIVLGVFGVAALLVSAVGMFNTMIVSFMERTYEVGVMKSLGARDKDVRNLFLMESMIMGLAGGVTGIVLGMGGGMLVNFVLNILAKRLGGEGLDLFITPYWFVAMVIASSAFIGLFSGFWPARRAAGLSPKEAFLRK